MWLDAAGTLKATYVKLDTNMGYSTSTTKAILTYLKEWDKFVYTLNESPGAEVGQVWHTSRLWIRAEAESAIVGSTVATLIVSVGFGFLGALCFTQLDFVLSMWVVLSVLGVTISLAWFMIAVLGWGVGAIEVLGLIVFVGYSITYALHIAHNYQEHMLELDSSLSKKVRREEAVSEAMRCMAGAVMGSAVTTLGASFFLFFCNLIIFVKLATVLFAVTFFAMVFSTVALPAALLVAGPTSDPRKLRRQLWEWIASTLQSLDQEEASEKAAHLAEGDVFATPKAASSPMMTDGSEVSPAASDSALLSEPAGSKKFQVFLSSTPQNSSFINSRPSPASSSVFARTSPFFPGQSPSVQPSPIGADITRQSDSFWAESLGSATQTETAPLQGQLSALRFAPPSWRPQTSSELARAATAQRSKPNLRPQISII